MLPAVLGLLAFLLFLCYDLGSLHGKRRAYLLFLAGCVLLISSALLLLWQGRALLTVRPTASLFWGIGVLFSLVLLCRALFFALPAKEAYHGGGQLVSTGWYALCRHPGALCFAGTTLCLWGLLQTPGATVALLLWNAAEFFYVLWQDRFLFPRTIAGYEEYRRETPFLIPTAASLRAALTKSRSL